MKKLIILSLLLVFLSPTLIAEIFVMKKSVVAVGDIVQETDTFIIVKKADNSRGYIRKDQVEYRIPEMNVTDLLNKAFEYTKNDDFKTAYFFYLAAEYFEPKKAEVIAGVSICLFKRKEYDKALAKVKYGLLWEKRNELILLQGEIYSLKGEFDKADEIFSKLKKKVPKLTKTIDELMKENQERRLFEQARTNTPAAKDFKDKIGNCKDAVDNAKKILKWSKESSDDTFIAVNLSVFSTTKKVSEIEDTIELRNSVSVVDLKIIVDKEKYSGVKTKLDNKERRILAYGWYFYIRSVYNRANRINIDICYEYTNRKKEQKIVAFASVKWGTDGKNLSIEYTR